MTNGAIGRRTDRGCGRGAAGRGRGGNGAAHHRRSARGGLRGSRERRARRPERSPASPLREGRQQASTGGDALGACERARCLRIPRPCGIPPPPCGTCAADCVTTSPRAGDVRWLNPGPDPLLHQPTTSDYYE